MNDHTKTRIRELLETIESASNRATGAALVRDQDVVVAAANEIGDACGRIDELLDEDGDA